VGIGMHLKDDAGRQAPLYNWFCDGSNKNSSSSAHGHLINWTITESPVRPTSNS